MASLYKIGERDSRPWGEWQVLDAGDGYVVKRIIVNPGARLSLQSHAHRSEVWTVVSGSAEAVVGETVMAVTSGDSVSIPTGVRHRMRNTGDGPMVFVEVQTGETLDEGDIIRYDDDYGRS